MTDFEMFGTDEPTRDQLVAAGLLEAEWYRDFDPGCDCYPEDWEDECV